jgi:hypothetical protein
MESYVYGTTYAYAIRTYEMGLFGFILLMVVILAIIGLGWKTFSTGVNIGFDKAVNVGTP